MKLTIFTPTYNRAQTLQRVYDSLCSQTDMRFEWLVVDDGSDDGTDQLMERLMAAERRFAIHYDKQQHGGKHRAQNLAIDHAAGDWFITCDSNKYMKEDAVENILRIAQTIPQDSVICGVGGYRANFSGELIGGEMDFRGSDHIDCTTIEREKYHILGDKSTAFRLSVLKNYKSPEFPGETFVTEGVWLLDMALDGYQIRWTPHVFVYGEYAGDGLTVQGANSRAGHAKNFRGFLAYLKYYIKAHGMEQATYFLNEAADIAKEKHWSVKRLAEELECPAASLRRVLWKKAVVKKINSATWLKKAAKKVLGDKVGERLKDKCQI